MQSRIRRASLRGGDSVSSMKQVMDFATCMVVCSNCIKISRQYNTGQFGHV